MIFVACATYIIVVEWRNFFDHQSWIFWVLLPVYPLFSFLLLILLNQDEHARYLLLLMLALVNSFDSGAYLIGSLFGTYKIAPRISPGKTWEGTIGGFIICLFTLFFIVYFVSTQNSGFLTIAIRIGIIGISVGLLCFFGDLFESFLKRRAGIKDSGTIFPGHGGLLDRFDSILFVIVFFYFFRNWLISIF